MSLFKTLAQKEFYYHGCDALIFIISDLTIFFISWDQTIIMNQKTMKRINRNNIKK